MGTCCFRNILWCACLVLASIGCSSADLKHAAADPPYDVYDAMRAADVPSGSLIRIHCDVPGEIQIITYPSNEVALDVIPTGWGNDIGGAADEAHQKIDVNLNVAALASGLKEITIDAQFDANQSVHDVRDRLVLHLRVPPRVRINVDTLQVQTASTNLVVDGEVEQVEARLNKGDITVNGAVGDLYLSTQQGNIRADARGSRLDFPNKIDVRTHHGNIEVFSVSDSVSAQADNGNVRFVGALAGSENSFVALGAGNLVIAIPNDVTHEFRIQGGSQVVTDYASGALVCGFIQDAASSAIDESFRMSQDSIGYVNFTHMITLTDKISGVITPQKYVFHTNRGAVTKYIPSTSAQPERDRSLLPDVARCHEPVQPSAVRFDITAQKGEVYIRLIRKLADK